MSTPISVRVSKDKRKEVNDWLLETRLFEFVSFDWYTCVISFEKEEDAAAFILKFGATRFKTTVERMIDKEN